MITERDSEKIFEALLKEAEFIRNEALLCIQNVRKVSVYSTTISGFAIPVMAGMINVRGNSSFNTISSLREAISDNVFILQFISLGVCLTCFAFLRIYVGNFLQIFTFAKYFRDHLIPSINSSVYQENHRKIELFHWENWLKNHREGKSHFIGDVDLAAEPILISSYILVYGGIFAFISYYTDGMRFFQ